MATAKKPAAKKTPVQKKAEAQEPDVTAEELEDQESDTDAALEQMREMIDSLEGTVASLSGEIAELREQFNTGTPGRRGVDPQRPAPRPKPSGPNVPMMVRATNVGHYGSLRHPGAEFEIMSHGFSEAWMEKIEPNAEASED